MAWSHTEKTMISKIEESLRKILGSDIDDFSMPEIVKTENKPPVTVYGKYNVRDINDKAEELREFYTKQYPELGDDVVWWTCVDCFVNRYINKSHPIPAVLSGLVEEMKKLMSEHSCSIVTCAEYSSKEDQILLYEKAFDEYDEPERTARISRVLAHEIFHAYHYYLAPDTYNEDSYYAEVVREALADFFSYLFCIDIDILDPNATDTKIYSDLARERYYFWHQNIFVDIPYPKAIFFRYNDGQLNNDHKYEKCLEDGSIEKFLHIFELSKIDMYRAYLELVPEEFRNNSDTENYDNLAIPDRANLGFNVKRVIWDAIKYCVATYEISSLQELQDFFPSDYITFIRGRFLQFDSGELLAEYPQWEIKDGYKLLKFIENKGYFKPYSDNAVDLKEGLLDSSPKDEVYINKFRYESGGGMIMMYTDPRRFFTEIDRDNCTIETYKQEVDYRGNRGEREEIHRYPVSKEFIEPFFNELEIANWEDGPFMKHDGLDCPMWYIDLTYSDGSNFHTQGSGGDGPKNFMRIQQRYIDLMKEAGLSKNKIFFTR